jgi:ribosomal-protein-alanine N-acetyltransferase
MNIPVLITDRLILRPLELADADSIQKLFPRWEIVRFLVAEIPIPPMGPKYSFVTLRFPLWRRVESGIGRLGR